MSLLSCCLQVRVPRNKNKPTTHRGDVHVARIAMVFGVALVALGIGLYYSSDPDHRSYTAFIPSGLGVVIFLAGQFAQSASEKIRMHSMHAAATAALIGAVGGAVMTALDI